MKKIIIVFCFITALFQLARALEIKSDRKEDKSRTEFNSNWLFARFGSMPDGSIKEEPTGLGTADINDAGWRRLDLPHDWGIEGPFRMDLQSTSGKLPWAGIGWYRKHFTVSRNEKGKCFFIDFDGAMSHAKVWLNGQFIGEWPYGYSSFRLEMTPYIRHDKENVIAAIGNGDPTNHRSFQTDRYKVFHGQCMLIIKSIKGKKGPIHITAKSEKLESGILKIVTE